MSADYWNSSQRSRWQFTRYSLLEARRKLLFLERRMIQNGLIRDYPNIVYDYNMRIYLHNLLLKLGRRMNVRQIAIATAEVYLSRFLTRVSLKEINVYLLVTTCLYVACKIEECPQHIRLILSEARNIWSEYIPHDVTKLAEFEFYLIEEMDSYMVLHHPYKLLIQLRDFLETKYEVYGFKLSEEEMQNSWSLINDSYITDLHLLVPPHIIAVAAIYITVVLKKNLAQLRNKTSPSGISSLMSTMVTGTKNNNLDNSGAGTYSTKGISQNSITPEMLNSLTDGVESGLGSGSGTGSGLGLGESEGGGLSNEGTGVAGVGDSGVNVKNLQIDKGNKTTPSPTILSDHHLLADSLQAAGHKQEPRLQLPKTKGMSNLDFVNFEVDILDEDTINIHKFMNFLEHSHINLDEVVEAVQDMVGTYVLWNRYNEQGVKKALQIMLLRR